MNSEVVITAVVAITTTLTASSGFWAYLQSRDKKKNATTQIIAGLAYDKITTLGISYIDRGWISNDEYEDFRKLLYDPYRDLGGNGLAERIMYDVQRLPIRTYASYLDIAESRSDNKGE